MTKRDDDTAPPVTESVFRRYVATLAAQSVRLVLSVIAASVVPRVLGPVAFGNYSYLATTASTLRGFLDPSVQQTFFTFSSQERRSGALTRLYGAYLLLQLAVILGLIALASWLGVTDRLWPGQALDQILWVTVLDWTIFLAASLQQLGDSKGLTVRPQAIGALVAAVTIAALILLATMGWLDLHSYIWLNLTSAAVTAAFLCYYLLRRHGELCWAGSIGSRALFFVKRWWAYASPLIALEYYLLIVSFLGVYLIQRWYGSSEQGYYALALKWSAVALVFMSAAIMIVWREIATAFAAGDRERSARVFQRFSQSLFFLAASLGFWLLLVSENLILLVAGEHYRRAVPVMMIMAFYPIAQTVASLNAAAYKGMGRTREYRNLSMWLSLPDLMLSYVLLAGPQSIVPGLGLGAVGMALKITGWGLVSVQILEWRTCRHFAIDFWGETKTKLVSIAWMALCAALAYSLARSVSGEAASNQTGFIVVVSLQYWALIGMLTVARPSTIGLDRSELRDLRRVVLARIGMRSRR